MWRLACYTRPVFGHARLLPPSCTCITPFAACVLSQRLARLQPRPARGGQTAEIAAAKAAHKVQEGAAAAYEVTKQKAGEAYASTAEYLKEKVSPATSRLSLNLFQHGSIQGPMSAAGAFTCVPAAAIHRLITIFLRFATKFDFLAAHLLPCDCVYYSHMCDYMSVYSLIKSV